MCLQNTKTQNRKSLLHETNTTSIFKKKMSVSKRKIKQCQLHIALIGAKIYKE